MRLLRIGVAAAVAVLVAALVLAAVAVQQALARADTERALLLDIVCASVELRRDFDDPSAREWHRRLDTILARYGEQGRCGP